MIVTKEIGTNYEKQLDANIILYHINENKIIAEINRELTYTSEDQALPDGSITKVFNYVDDITPEEIQAGTQTVKEYCLANDCINLYYEYMLAITEADKQLPILKEQKHNEIKVKQNNLIEGTIVFEGNTFQTRQIDKINISGKVSEIMLDKVQQSQKITNVNWININNDHVTFTVDKFLAFAVAIAKQTETITFKANVLKAKIEAAKTIEELEKIQWDDDPVKSKITSQKKI